MNLEERIKEVIIERLNLSVKPEDISNDAPIFSADSAEDNTDNGGFELDSIDALEMVIALNKEFKVTITDKDMGIFKSVNTIAAYIRENSSLAEAYE